MTTTVSYSQISTFRQCPLKWELQSLERLRPPTDKPQLVLGQAVHRVLEAHYNILAHGAANGWSTDGMAEAARDAAVFTIERLLADGLPDDLAERVGWIYDGYANRYGIDPEWEILGVEQEIDVPMYRGGGGVVRFTGRIDLVVRERATGRIWVVDFKTGAGKDASGAAWTREQDLDDQFGLYQQALTHKVPTRDRLPVFGTIYALIRSDRLQRSMTQDERFNRLRMFRSEQTLEAIWGDAILTARAMGRVRTGWVAGRPTYSAPDPTQCRWRCSFVDAHLLARATGRGAAAVARDYGFVSRDAPVEPEVTQATE